MNDPNTKDLIRGEVLLLLTEFSDAEAKVLATEITEQLLLRMKRHPCDLKQFVKVVTLDVIDAKIDLAEAELAMLTDYDSVPDLTTESDGHYEELRSLFGEDGTPTLDLLFQGYSQREAAERLGINCKKPGFYILRAKKRAQRRIKF